MIDKEWLKIGEYGASGMYEEQKRSLFYKKALGLRRYFENCPLPKYTGKSLYPSGKMKTDTCVRPGYRFGMEADYDELNIKSKALADKFKEDFDVYSSSVPHEHTVGGSMWTHSHPHYERIIKEGFLSYIPRIEKIADKDMREGLLHLIKGIKNYAERCVNYLISCGAEERLINGLKIIPMQPAKDFYQAVLCWNFILYLDNCDNLGCLASGLSPYYHGEEDAITLIENLYDNLDENDGYSMQLGIEKTPLDIICLEASKGKRRPMIELFVDDNTDDDLWEKAFEVVKTNNGQPAFYNKNVLLPEIENKLNVGKEDIKKFCGGGCTESMIAGFSNVGSLDAGINLLFILANTVNNGLKTAKTFDEFYDLYINDVRNVIEKVTFEISSSQKIRAKLDPLPMRTLLVDDCIDNGKDFNDGGARYKWSVMNFAGIVNVIDSLLSIKGFVFDDKKYTGEEVVNLLKNGDGEFLKNCRNYSVCYGVDDGYANEFSKKLTSDIFSMLDDKKPYFGGGFIPSSIQFNSQVWAGKMVQATPDGRECGSPLADSLGAIFSKDVLGPTALLNSVSSLDLKRMIGTPVLNFNVTEKFSNKVIKALINGYFDNGGIQIQLTCASKETLLDAYSHPEDHKNLVVRVGGYSEYFYRLSDELKKMIIARTVQNLS